MNISRFASLEVVKQEYDFERKYESEMESWVNNLNLFCEILFDQKPIELTHFTLFDQSLFFGFTNKEMILKMFEYVNLPTEIDSSYIQQILKPEKYIFGTEKFKMNLFTSYIEKAPMRYISNVDAFDLLNEAEKILKSGNAAIYDIEKYTSQFSKYVYNGKLYIGHEHVMLLREASLMKNFVMKYCGSRRLLPIHKLIQVVFETSYFDEKRGFVWKENPVLGAFKKLYDGYDEFPFREVDGQTFFEKSGSMALPELSFALIELWFKYVLIDMTKEELITGINILLEWSCTSLDEHLLNFKDSRLNISKILIDQAISMKGIKHGIKSLWGTVIDDDPREIWMDDDVTLANDYISYVNEFLENAPTYLIKYLVKIGVMKDLTSFSRMKHISCLSEVRRLYIVINVLTQHGLFIKNPVILTIEKSILPRASIALTPKKATYIENKSIFSSKMPFQLNWEEVPIFRQMLFEGRKLIAHYIEKYDKLDLEAEYIKALTNNSGGVDYQPTDKEKVDVPGQILKGFGKKRLMYFLLNPTLFESYPAWIGALKSMTNSGERKQVDRRGRVIQMVSNAAQLAPFLLFMLADVMGKEEPELSSKKNTGTIVDINALLRSTGDLCSVQESADISGMDASTTRAATSLINGVLIELLQKCHHDRYFFSGRRFWKLFEENDGETKFIGEKEIHPGVGVLQISEMVSESYNYKLTIPELTAFGVKVVMDTSPQVFPSGKFSTNAQHSLLNMLILRVFKASLLPKLIKLNIPIFDLDVKVSGDDIYAAFKMAKIEFNGSRCFSKELVKVFSQVGFKIGSLLSRYGATFLQQSAIFGTVLPKPDRISMTTSEHGDSLKLSAFEAFAEFRDITKEMCGRVHFPMNTRGLLNAVANQLRRVRVNIRDVPVSMRRDMQGLKRKIMIQDVEYCIKRGMSRDYIPWKLIIGLDYIHFVIPLISLFSSRGFDLPFNSMYLNHYVTKSNVFSPRGSIVDWKVRRLLLKAGQSFFDFSLSNELLTKLKLNAAPKDQIQMSRRDLEDSNAQIRTEVRKFINELYDHELAAFIGMNWLNHFSSFSVKEILERIRLNKFPKHVRDEWADRLMFRLNFDSIVRSRLAGMRLEQAGFKTSKRLAFYNTPNERVTQAIISGGDSTMEFKIHRLELFLHMLRFSPQMGWLQDIEYEALLLQDFKMDCTTKIPMTREFIIDLDGQLMLSSSRDQDRDLFLYKFGHNFYDLTAQFSGYYALNPGPFKDYKHAELVKFASKVYNDRPDLLHFVWEFANIHDRYRRELEGIVQFGEMDVSEVWKSVVHTRQCFELSTSLRHVSRIWNERATNDRRIDQLLLVVMRDIAISENKILLNKATLKISLAFLLIHGSMRSKLNSLVKLGDSSNKV